MRRPPRQIAAAALLSFATVAATFGQTPEPRTSGQTTTIVGCLVQRPSPNADEFFLRTPAVAVPAGTQVKIDESPPPGSGRATASAGTPTGTTLYRVTGLTPTELKPHLNHRLELQGNLTQNVP